MSLSELLRKGLIEEFESDAEQVRNQAELARTDLASAKKILEIGDWKWAYNAAYNAMLQAGRGLMFSKGFRPKSQEGHVAVISFVNAVYSSKIPEDIRREFDRARRHRNEATYDQAGVISESQARSIVEKAGAFVNAAMEILRV